MLLRLREGRPAKSVRREIRLSVLDRLSIAGNPARINPKNELKLPVSTTHVSVGALFSIGVISGTARTRTVLGILLAWATTLPLGALSGSECGSGRRVGTDQGAASSFVGNVCVCSHRFAALLRPFPLPRRCGRVGGPRYRDLPPSEPCVR